MAFRAPLLGYNTNVRHKGKLYHIQTEDSGVEHPHVITHLFADGGRIVASKKTSYADRIGSDGLPETVKKLMQTQHKAMFIALRDGVYDEDGASGEMALEPREPAPRPDLNGGGPARIAPAVSEVGAAPSERVAAVAAPELGPGPARLSAAPADASGAVRFAPSPELAAPLSTRAAVASLDLNGSLPGRAPPLPRDLNGLPGRVPPPPLDILSSRVGSAAPELPSGLPVRPPPVPTDRVSKSGDPAAKGMGGAGERTTGLTVTQPHGVPGKTQDLTRSLFGGELLSDKTLDEVILNYLAANENES